MAKILIIDDDTQLLGLMTAFLEKEHEIATAVNGKLGMRLLESQQFDLIITDVMMPERDGLEVLTWLNHQTTHPKVIAISGGSISLGQDILLLMCKNLNADKVLPKPVDFKTLTTAVREVLG
jgi:DNA-binding response OmpR family regulator